MILRRKRLAPELQGRFEAFIRVVSEVEAAKSALTESVPSTRSAGRLLAESLSEFEARLNQAAAGMTSWRCPEVEETWLIAQRGLSRALALAEGVRLEAEEPRGFEQLIGLLGDLLAPLEAFRGAAEAFKWLRRRRRG